LKLPLNIRRWNISFYQRPNFKHQIIPKLSLPLRPSCRVRHKNWRHLEFKNRTELVIEKKTSEFTTWINIIWKHFLVIKQSSWCTTRWKKLKIIEISKLLSIFCFAWKVLTALVLPYVGVLYWKYRRGTWWVPSYSQGTRGTSWSLFDPTL